MSSETESVVTRISFLVVIKLIYNVVLEKPTNLPDDQLNIELASHHDGSNINYIHFI